MNTTTVRSYALSDFDMDVLNRVSVNGAYEKFTAEHWDGSGTYEAQREVAQAYIVWIDETDGLCFGPVRSRAANCWCNADGTKEDYWSASPFPGAWSAVPLRRILSVRHDMY